MIKRSGQMMVRRPAPGTGGDPLADFYILDEESEPILDEDGFGILDEDAP